MNLHWNIQSILSFKLKKLVLAGKDMLLFPDPLKIAYLKVQANSIYIYSLGEDLPLIASFSSYYTLIELIKNSGYIQVSANAWSKLENCSSIVNRNQENVLILKDKKEIRNSFVPEKFDQSVIKNYSKGIHGRERKNINS